MADDPKFWVALSTSALALAGTLYTAIANNRLARLNATLELERDERLAQRESQKIIAKFRDPLMHAAYDLQSRLYNILRQDFLHRYYTNGSAREKEYAVENTVFLLAQFLGWTEAIREEIQFLDLGLDGHTKKLRALQDGIYSQLQNDTLGAGFRLFAGEQRAVGELMLDRTAPVCRCMGFASFAGRNQAIDFWLDPLREDVNQMAAHLKPFEKRLVTIQHSMIDLLEFLDPDCIRFPRATRSKV